MNIIEKCSIRDVEIELGDIIKIVDDEDILYRMIVYTNRKYNMINLNGDYSFKDSYARGYDTKAELISELISDWSNIYVAKNKDVTLNIPNTGFVEIKNNK